MAVNSFVTDKTSLVRENYTMLMDFYELTMGNGYFLCGKKDTISYFDIFFRNIPDGGGFAIAAGLEQIVDYIKNLNFSEEDIEYLRGKGCFSEEIYRGHLCYSRGYADFPERAYHYGQSTRN